jgi:hypothetical protein
VVVVLEFAGGVAGVALVSGVVVVVSLVVVDLVWV